MKKLFLLVLLFTYVNNIFSQPYPDPHLTRSLKSKTFEAVDSIRLGGVWKSTWGTGVGNWSDGYSTYDLRYKQSFGTLQQVLINGNLSTLPIFLNSFIVSNFLGYNNGVGQLSTTGSVGSYANATTGFIDFIGYDKGIRFIKSDSLAYGAILLQINNDSTIVVKSSIIGITESESDSSKKLASTAFIKKQGYLKANIETTPAKMGAYSNVSTFAWFGHQNFNNSTLHALLQTDGGVTVLNSNGTLFLRTGAIDRLTLSSLGATFSQPVILKSYTTATLPTGIEGALAYVTDAVTPTYNVTVVGGGTIKIPVFYNGINWVAH